MESSGVSKYIPKAMELQRASICRCLCRWRKLKKIRKNMSTKSNSWARISLSKILEESTARLLTLVNVGDTISSFYWNSFLMDSWQTISCILLWEFVIQTIVYSLRTSQIISKNYNRKSESNNCKNKTILNRPIS